LEVVVLTDLMFFIIFKKSLLILAAAVCKICRRSALWSGIIQFSSLSFVLCFLLFLADH